MEPRNDEHPATRGVSRDARRAIARVDLPAELVDATVIEAAREADRVALFLHELGLLSRSDRTVGLPPAFLLHLGAALRLLVWEANGLRVHRDQGLPRAEQAIIDAFGTLTHESGAEGPHPAELPRE